MDRTELLALGYKLKALGQTRGDWLDYIEGTLPILTMKPMVAPKTELPRVQSGCSVCDERRRQKAQSQKKWRKGRTR